MIVDVGFVDLFVALGGLDALGRHRLVGDEEEGAGRDLVVKTGDENRGCLHIDREGPDFF